MTSIEELFPITVTITQRMINTSIPMNPRMCQGALALRHGLGKFSNGRDIQWGAISGKIDDQLVTTEEGLMLPLITSPVKVTFVLVKPQSYEESTKCKDL
jgi:hypothetical protein